MIRRTKRRHILAVGALATTLVAIPTATVAAGNNNPPPKYTHAVEVVTTTTEAPTTTTTAPTSTTAPKAATDRLKKVKGAADTAVTNRISELDRLVDQLDKSKNITAEHRSAMKAELSLAKTGLADLNKQIQADVDVASTVADAKRIVTDYRVYVLEIPKVHELMAVDGMVTATNNLTKVATDLRKATDAMQAAGKDVTTARASVDALNAKILNAQKGLDGLSDLVISLQPGGYPTNKASLQSTRATLKASVDSLNGVRADVDAILAALKV